MPDSGHPLCLLIPSFVLSAAQNGQSDMVMAGVTVNEERQHKHRHKRRSDWVYALNQQLPFFSLGTGRV